MTAKELTARCRATRLPPANGSQPFDEDAGPCPIHTIPATIEELEVEHLKKIQQLKGTNEPQRAN